MRNQEISACLGNVSYTDVQHCAGCDAATRSQCFGKIKRGLPRIRDPQAVLPAAGLQAQTMHSTAEEHCTGTSRWLILVCLLCAHSAGIAGEWGSDSTVCLSDGCGIGDAKQSLAGSTSFTASLQCDRNFQVALNLRKRWCMTRVLPL